MRYPLLLPLALLGLAGCVNVHDRPAPEPSSTTYVTPAPAMAPATTTTTVVRSP
jgi:hypothetical protein